jgi:hypothetical protein
MTTHATLSRFCQAKSRIITIYATGRSLLGYLEGRLLRGRTIRVSQTVGGGSFDGVVLLSGLFLSGLLVRRLSHFQQMIFQGTLHPGEPVVRRRFGDNT